MAASTRHPLIRSVCNNVPTKRAFASKATTYSTSARIPTNTGILTRPASRIVQALNARNKPLRIVPFHTTSRRNILPPEPQSLEGTANEPAKIPTPNPAHGNYHWTFERIVSAALVPVTIAPFAGGALHPVLDATFCALLIMHSHVGFQSSIIDYLPKKRVPKTRTFCDWLLRATTLATAVGLYEFETNDVGLTAAVARIWRA